MQSKRSHSGARTREQGGSGAPGHALRVGIAIAALAMLVAVEYGNILPNGFVWDDSQQVAMNPDLRPGSSWLRLFASDVWGFTHPGEAARTNYYRPLQMVAYRIVGGLFGFQPPPFHILSIVLAMACTLAAFFVYFLLTRRLAIAFAAATLFAVHPVHTEAVDWISALPDLGCALFVLLSFAFFLRFRSDAPGGTARRLDLTASLLCFTSALLWKEPAAVLPAVVAVFVFFDEEGEPLKRLGAALQACLPYAGPLAAYLAVRYRALGFFSTPMRLWQLSPAQAAGSMVLLMAQYWRALLQPLPLNAYHYFAPGSLPLARLLLAGAVVPAGMLAIAWAVRHHAARRSPSTGLAAFAALWTILFLLPVMDIWALGRNAFAERYLYLPSIGFCLLVVLLVSAAISLVHRGIEKVQPENRAADLRGSARILAVSVLLAVVVAAGAMATWRRNPDWQSNATLFRAALPLSPQAPFVHFMVAATEDDSFLAEQEYRRTISLAESEQPPAIAILVQACENLAAMYGDRGRFAEALQLLAQARRANPNDPDIDAAEGALLLRAGRWEEAAPLLERATSRPAPSENALNALALLEWQNRHDRDRAAELFRRALEVHPLADEFSASLHNNLGAVYAEGGFYARAAEQFGTAVQIVANDAEYRTNFAAALAALGRYPDAAQQAQLALQIAPGFPPALQLLRQLQSR